MIIAIEAILVYIVVYTIVKYWITTKEKSLDLYVEQLSVFIGAVVALLFVNYFK